MPPNASPYFHLCPSKVYFDTTTWVIVLNPKLAYVPPLIKTVQRLPFTPRVKAKVLQRLWDLHPSFMASLPRIANLFFRLLLFALVLTLVWSHWCLAVSPLNVPGRAPYHIPLPHPGTWFSQILMWLASCLSSNSCLDVTFSDLLQSHSLEL